LSNVFTQSTIIYCIIIWTGIYSVENFKSIILLICRRFALVYCDTTYVSTSSFRNRRKRRRRILLISYFHTITSLSILSTYASFACFTAHCLIRELRLFFIFFFLRSSEREYFCVFLCQPTHIWWKNLLCEHRMTIVLDNGGNLFFGLLLKRYRNWREDREL